MDKTVILDGKTKSKEILENIKKELDPFLNKPRLDIFLIGEDMSSLKYVEMKSRAASYVGINVVLHKYDETIPEQSLLTEINDLNQNPDVTGIMVQLPLPYKFDQNTILNTIDASKDVDGLTAINLGKVFAGRNDGFLSATARGIKDLLLSYDVPVMGKDVVVVGTSIEVGLPSAAFLFNMGATVQMCNLSTNDVLEKTSKADIIISATGQPKLITKKYVKPGAVVIDVGFSVVDGRTSGDVDFENVAPICSYISPVPGGVGPMTVASLLSNTLDAFKRAQDEQQY